MGTCVYVIDYVFYDSLRVTQLSFRYELGVEIWFLRVCFGLDLFGSC